MTETELTMPMKFDDNNFFINNTMNRYDYMKLTLDIIREEIIEQYNLIN